MNDPTNTQPVPEVVSTGGFGSVAVLMWNGSGLNVLIPKKRGSGYLMQPYGHHSVEALRDIEFDEGLDMCGLDGCLVLECGAIYDTAKRDAFVARVLPRLAKYYGFTQWREDEKAFWSVLRPNTEVRGG